MHYDVNDFQKYIDDYIHEQNKLIIFIGNNEYNVPSKTKKIYYNLRSKYNYYIHDDDADIIKQKCIHFLNYIREGLDGYKNNLTKHNTKKIIKDYKISIQQFIDMCKGEYNAKQIIHKYRKHEKTYIKKGYKSIHSDNIDIFFKYIFKKIFSKK